MAQGLPGSFIRIVPVLVLVPVLSFYLFSFESIRDSLQKGQESIYEFNLKVGGEMDELLQNTEDIAFKYYADRTLNIGKLVNYFDTQVNMQYVLKYFSGRWLGM